MTHPRLVVPPEVMRLGVVRTAPGAEFSPRGYRLSELASELALFTIGPLMTYGGLDIDPVGEFVATHPDPACDVMLHDFAEPLFRGVARGAAEEAWDRRLFLVARRYWDELLRYLSGITIVDRRRGFVARAVPQVTQVVDVGTSIVAGREYRTMDVIPITGFGLASNQMTCRFGQFLSTDGVTDLIVDLPDAGMTTAAAQYLAVGPEATHQPENLHHVE
jgi:hypothetical protein